MTTALVLAPAPDLLPARLFAPTPKAAKRVLEFFTAQINNDHTRKAYLNATRRFAAWCEAHDLDELAAGAAVPRRRVRQGATAPVHRAHGEAAPRGAAHAVRLAGDRPRPRHQPGSRRARPALRRDEGQDAGARRRRGARPARFHPDRFADRAARPRADRRHGLQLRPRQRGASA